MDSVSNDIRSITTDITVANVLKENGALQVSEIKKKTGLHHTTVKNSLMRLMRKRIVLKLSVDTEGKMRNWYFQLSLIIED